MVSGGRAVCVGLLGKVVDPSVRAVIWEVSEGSVVCVEIELILKSVDP